MGNIEFERIWEDDSFFEIRCKANSDNISIAMNTYVNDKIIDELTSKIRRFINQKIKEFVWETGERGSNSTPDFMIKVFYKDRSRHIRIEVFCEIDDGALLEEHNCCFYIDGIETWQLEEFGKGIKNLKTLGIGTKVSII